MARVTKVKQTKKVKPSNVETATVEKATLGGCGVTQAALPPPFRLNNIYQIESLLSDYLAEARRYNRGEALLHIENARVCFEAACKNLHLANQTQRSL